MKKILLVAAAVAVVLLLVFCVAMTDSGNVFRKDKKKEEQSEEKTEIISAETLEEIVKQEHADTDTSLRASYEQLKMDISTYVLFKANERKVEEFYADVFTEHKMRTNALRESALSYAELILSSDSSAEQKYKEMEELYVLIYEQAGEELYNEIYNGILEEIYTFFYEGFLGEKDETVSYEEWNALRSNESVRWSAVKADVYDDWIDFRVDLYDFCSAMEDALLNNNLEVAKKVVEEFRVSLSRIRGD